MKACFTTLRKPDHLLTLDALRGVAALAVFQLHFFRVFGFLLFPHGYLAVDFFFMLSGFVLAHSYQDRLDSGWPTSAFLKVRLRRLYPLFFASLVLGLTAAILVHNDGLGIRFLRSIFVLFLLSCFAIPNPAFQGTDMTIFPLNRPAWSLFYESIANIAHAVFLRRRSQRFLAVVVVTFATLFAVVLYKTRHADIGAMREYIPALCRVMFSYTAGLLLHRLWKSGRARLKVPPLIPVLVLPAVMAVPSLGRLDILFQAATIYLFFPVLLLMGASLQAGEGYQRPFAWLGSLSYAIYVLHHPVLDLFYWAWLHVRHHGPELDAPWSGIAGTVFLILGAYFFHHRYDVPVRKTFSRNTRPAASLPASGTS